MRRNPAELALGIDLGGTKILTAVATSDGEVLSRDYTETSAEKGYKAVIESIVASANRALVQAGISVGKLAAVGIGAAGLSSPEAGVLFTSPHLPGWHDVPLRDAIEKKLGKKTFLTNDANAAALGELYFGAARGARNFIYVTISTGIGGGIVIDGKIYAGALGTAGE
ncbi:MAG: ROK family protein [Chloroflexi bacterium]|nr:ROK family protein [Chloroflexota bacterium]